MLALLGTLVEPEGYQPFIPPKKNGPHGPFLLERVKGIEPSS